MANKIVTTDNLKPILRTVGGKVNELEKQIKEPQTLTLENECNDFSVGVDNNGTKYNVIESSESTIELNGRTLVNLWGNKRDDFEFSPSEIPTLKNGVITSTAQGTYVWTPSKGNLNMFKPSTTYTIITNVITNTLNHTFFINSQSNGQSVFNDNIILSSGEIGVFVNLLISKNDLSNCLYSIRSIISSSTTTGSISYQCIILEGDYTNVPIEYFEGLKSSEPTEVKSIGKNLVTEMHNQQVNGKESKNHISMNLSKKLELGKTYTVSVSDDVSGSIYCYGTYCQKVNEGGSYTFTFPSITRETDKYQFNIYNSSKEMPITNETWIQLEEGTQATPYGPYKENVVTLPNIEPLRSLPNGVCDEAFIHDDKLVITRRIGKVVYNENNINEWWRNSVTDSKEDVFVASRSVPNDIDKALGITGGYAKYILSDKFINKVDTNTPNNIYTTGASIVLTISNTHTPNSTIEEFKTWITNNPFIMIYQLATPIYEWYELPSPHLYKDGHVFIETGSIPLTTTEHKVNLSLRSAIDTNVEEIVQIKEELNELDMTIATDVTELVNLIKDGE